uniref:L1 transposable element RRM domain-containing protein n=1 Tax=Photinus pyralis TaxID=7054 RepID=A0A1Y1JZ86_PHOPY
MDTALSLQLEAIAGKLSKLDDINTIVLQLTQLNHNVSEMQSTILQQGEKIDKCVQNIYNLKQENVVLHKKIAELEIKLNSSKSEVFQEMHSRMIRERNVIMLGIDEAVEEEDQINEILKDISLGHINFEYVLRVGKPTAAKPRPLKVIFKNANDALKVLKSKSKIPREKFPVLQIKNDKTPLQMKECKEAYAEMERRKNLGENVSLRFFNNTPTIVVNSKRSREYNSPEINAPKNSRKNIPAQQSSSNRQGY